MNKMLILLLTVTTLAFSACGKKGPTDDNKFQSTEQTKVVFQTSMKGTWALSGGCTTLFSMNSNNTSESLKIIITDDGNLTATMTTYQGNATCQTKDAIITEDNYTYNAVINSQISETESQLTLTSTNLAIDGILNAVIKVKYTDGSKTKVSVTPVSGTYQTGGKQINMDPALLKGTVLNLNKIL